MEEYNLRRVEPLIQQITRKTHFSAGHRIVNEGVRCRHYHGHEFYLSTTYNFSQTESLGYAIDFKEIKRVHYQWIDDNLDHAFIANPKDTPIIRACQETNSNIWLMTLEDGEFSNPSVEFLAREVFLAMEILTENYPLLRVEKVELHETENCFTTCYANSIPQYQRVNFRKHRYEQIKQYALDKGVLEYDMTKVQVSGD